ncbi:hypothetical protein L7F22_044137 [Adiantum nelumboides]|nr:hypothetical protein [Adiantum nelumboides]
MSVNRDSIQHGLGGRGDSIQLPAHDSVQAQSASIPPSPDAIDDSASIHSRHALKVFKNGKPASKNDSPLASDISITENGEERSRTMEQNAAAGTLSEEEAAQWKQFRNRTLLRAAMQFTTLLIICAALLFLTLYFVLPKIDEADRANLKIPRSFEQLKALNAVLQRYKDEYFFRVMFCWIVIYMFLQAFSIPGSMYMSIIAGAMWGVPLALPIVCASVATGATICYLISMYLGAVLVAMPKWKARVDAWGEVLAQHNDNMMSYMIVIRMMPLPPHNVVNIMAPHLGIGIPLFWTSTFFGIFAVSIIHVTIGEKLDQMTSADDFHLFSLRNVLLLGGVIAAVLTPVIIKKYSAAANSPLEEDTNSTGGRIRLPDDDRENGYRNGGFDSEDDEDELPRIRRLHGARRSGSSDDPGELDEEGRAAYVARAWRGVEVDADQSDDFDGTGYSDGEGGSVPVFEDRREQGSIQRGRKAPPKARRVLGLGGQNNSRSGLQQDSYIGKAQDWFNSRLGRT